jgi:hypothetical protein
MASTSPDERALTHDYAFYGQKLKAPEVVRFLEHIFASNERAEAAGLSKTPVCIWGTHGIGKTETVTQLARDKSYKLAYVAPAQFEEMGDLIGMPVVDAATGRTKFCPPDWVPTEEGPGILLLDDANRADLRILRGIMQLLQRFELASWKLPPRWQIVVTANPDGGDYAVTPMDGAMLTRLLHVTMHFDIRAWSAWAERAGVDSRVINFALSYPEIIDGQRTTPRSLVQFSKLSSSIEDLEQDEPLVAALAEACLDKEAAATFLSFVRAGQSRLISPSEILEAKDFDKDVSRPISLAVDKKAKRVDVLAVLCTRLINHMRHRRTLSKEQTRNLKSFVMMATLPSDLRLVFARELVGLGSVGKQLASDPEVAELVLQGM